MLALVFLTCLVPGRSTFDPIFLIRSPCLFTKSNGRWRNHCLFNPNIIQYNSNVHIISFNIQTHYKINFPNHWTTKFHYLSLNCDIKCKTALCRVHVVIFLIPCLWIYMNTNLRDVIAKEGLEWSKLLVNYISSMTIHL